MPYHDPCLLIPGNLSSIIRNTRGHLENSPIEGSVWLQSCKIIEKTIHLVLREKKMSNLVRW